jgi:hypothetical protein
VSCPMFLDFFSDASVDEDAHFGREPKDVSGVDKTLGGENAVSTKEGSRGLPGIGAAAHAARRPQQSSVRALREALVVELLVITL